MGGIYERDRYKAGLREGESDQDELCGEKLVWEKDWFRYLTVKECERLQGFPDDWTKGISDNQRYWQLGNAVNCNVSKYLFNSYLPKVWGDL